jgi:hypothetical protein
MDGVIARLEGKIELPNEPQKPASSPFPLMMLGIGAALLAVGLLLKKDI